MLVSESMAKARSCMAVLLLFLSGTGSFWFTISGDTTTEYSLCRRLGFTSADDYYAFMVTAGLAKYTNEKGTTNRILQFSSAGWKDFLDNSEYGLTTDLVEYEPVRTDMVALLKGFLRVRRDQYHVLRIGRLSDESPRRIFHQMNNNGTLITTPPSIRALRAKQRRFGRKVWPLIMRTVVEDEDLYNDVSKNLAKPENPAAEETEEAGTATYATPSPNKKARTVAQPSQPTPPPNSTTSSTTLSATSSVLRVPEQFTPTVASAAEAEMAKRYPKATEAGIKLSEAYGEEGAAETYVDPIIADLFAFKQELSGSNIDLIYNNYRYGKQSSYVKIPTTSTDKGFGNHTKTIERIYEINGKNDSSSKSVKRFIKHAARKHPKVFKEALKELGMAPPEKMSATKQAAMYKAGRVSARKSRRMIARHLRDHFGSNILEPEYKVQLLGEGHTEVTYGSLEHAYVTGAVKETITWRQKNIAKEVAAQLKRQLESRSISIRRIVRIDIISGGDHGIGAFIMGAKIVVTLSDDCSDNESDDDSGTEEKDSFSFEISVAEIICRKDTAEVLSLTIRDELNAGFNVLAKTPFHIFTDAEGGVDCCFADSPPTNDAISHIKPNLYIVGDLAFYAMILGKEGSSGYWCYLCHLSLKEFSDLLANGDPWLYEEMKELAKKVTTKADGKKKSVQGVKEDPWWDCIPLENVIVPLLHCLIGIGNDILTKFRDWVSEHIEYLSVEETTARERKETIEALISGLVKEREAWKLTADGKEHSRLTGKLTRAKKALKDIGALSTLPASATSTVTDFLKDVDAFIELEAEGDVAEEEEDEMNEQDEDRGVGKSLLATLNGIVPENVEIKAKLEHVKSVVVETEKLKAPLDKAKKKITNRLSKARGLLKRCREKIKEFKKLRKRDGDGIESEMFYILKTMYNVKLQAYHGGSLTGKDIQKVMANAPAIFSYFATILISKKKANCSLTDAEIQAQCTKLSNLFMLWDGAFSYASKIDPTPEDIAMYNRFKRAAVFSHVKAGCNVTHKVHLMWCHVAKQMLVPGGLGQKREDWVEHQHQFTSQLRKQFESTKELGTRAHAVEGRHQMDTDPGVVAQQCRVDSNWEKGRRKDNITLEEVRKEERKKRRSEALQQWEQDNENTCVPVAEKLDWDDDSDQSEAGDDADGLLHELESEL